MLLNGYMDEQGPSGSEHLVLQQEINSLVQPPTPTFEGGVHLKPSGKELTIQEIKDKLPVEAGGEKTNAPDYIKGQLAQLLTPDEATILGIDPSHPLTGEQQVKAIKHLLRSLGNNPNRIQAIKDALPDLKATYNFPEIAASLQAIGIEALQQQFLKETQEKSKVSYAPSDDALGQASRRKVYSEMGGFGEEVTLEGEAMKVFGKTPEETARLKRTVEMDLRLAQSLFNAALPPEKVIEVAKLRQQIEDAKNPQEKTTLAHNLTLLRQKLYKAILIAYDVQPEKGPITIAANEKEEIEELAKQIRTRMETMEDEGKKLKNMNIQDANSLAAEQLLITLGVPSKETEELFNQQEEEMTMAFHAGEKLNSIVARFFTDKTFDNLSFDTKKIAQRILADRTRTAASIAGIDDYFAQPGGLKPENITFSTFLPMGLKGTELLYRRTLSKEELKEGTPQPFPEIPDWLNLKIPILELEQKDKEKENGEDKKATKTTESTTTEPTDQESSLRNYPISTYRKGEFREDVQKVLQRGEDWESLKKREPIPRRKKRREEPRPPGRESTRRIPNPKEELWKTQQIEPSEATEETLSQLEGLRSQKMFDELLTMWQRIDKDRQLTEQKGPYYEERIATRKKRLERLMQEELERGTTEDEIIALRAGEEEYVRQILYQARHRYAATTQRIGNEPSVKEDLEKELHQLDPQRAEQEIKREET